MYIGLKITVRVTAVWSELQGKWVPCFCTYRVHDELLPQYEISRGGHTTDTEKKSINRESSSNIYFYSTNYPKLDDFVATAYEQGMAKLIFSQFNGSMTLWDTSESSTLDELFIFDLYNIKNQKVLSKSFSNKNLPSNIFESKKDAELHQFDRL